MTNEKVKRSHISPGSVPRGPISSDVLASAATARVLVVGDLMLDRYWSGETRRISPEAPTPIVVVSDDRVVPGGAANVAENIAALGPQVSLLGLLGTGARAEALAGALNPNIVCQWVRSPNLRTIEKLRVLSQHQQLIRLDFEESLIQGSESDQMALFERFRVALPDQDVVLLSDYGKGTLARVADYIALAREHGKPVLVDPKGTDFSIYRGASLLTPNLKEFEAVVGACQGSQNCLVDRARALIQANEWEALLVTQGAQGMTLVPADGAPLHVSAQVQEVFDVTGAGDTVIATVASVLAAGGTLVEGVSLAAVAAGIVVGKLGTATVSIDALHRAQHHQLVGDQCVLDEATLLSAIYVARGSGERIVMTNGCFDVIHAGHVHYLSEAKRRGDRLIVAVNDDASVRRLKGSSRPVNSLKARMAVLAGLSMVDWVVPFSEDTPERLIEAVKPDVLIKGGDYTVETIVGANAVLARGGAVEVIPFLQGYSSTQILKKLEQ